MAKKAQIPLEPAFEPIDEGYTCFWDGSDVVIEIRRPQQTETALYAELVARLGDDIIHHARINLLSQYNLNDFQASCCHRDGHIPWASYLITIIEPLKRQLQQQAQVAADGGTASRTWEVFSLDDALKPRQPHVEIVKGLFTVPNLSIVYGPPGTLKTLLLMDMLLCIAANQPWLAPLGGHRMDLARDVMQASILWVDFDNGPRRTHERIAALARGHGLLTSENIHYVSMPEPWLNAASGDGLSPLEEAIERFEAKAVVIDNLLLIKGTVDENSAEMGTVMARLRRLTERYQSLIVPIHHQRKDQGGGGRSGDRLRGHSSIEAALDLALLVERDEGSSEITIRSTKTRDVDVTPFGAMFTYEHEPGTNLLHSARFFGIARADEQSDHAIERAIRGVLQKEKLLLKMELCSRVKAALPKVGVNRIRNVVERMVSQRHLKTQPGDRTEQYVFLPFS
jgi:RecA-family ATPase